jgi:hypothetical protein
MIAASLTTTTTAGNQALTIVEGSYICLNVSCTVYIYKSGGTTGLNSGGGPWSAYGFYASEFVRFGASGLYPSGSSYPAIIKGNRPVGAGPSVVAGSNDAQTSATTDVFAVSYTDTLDDADNTFYVNAAGMPRLGIGNTTATPTCDATERGRIWVVEGGAGVTDTISMCLKAAADTYSWITITTGG